ncbi:Nucleotide-binding universal stress protein, UspA family [Peptoclostridium litorale DSM 5388]|uniref:UspA domain-containing protein n=1 Tax=Peptoclostridium litorale DSM 5388 TaxID=1121324 RepID=A0A069RKS1_PEPLI|nr:universal stress protein [Peptoclostridium litorale]KDR94837.1 hypothetical protein CLIT_13c01590 [Peptoclostridium litorale DSM 5388]SIN93773.1 Nucleotide-binding universal stress protein, UspA family [Peptoclostridium litorale DSM 5388]
MKILLPYDGSDYCFKAFEYVIEHIQTLGRCEIYILNVQKGYLPGTVETSYMSLDSCSYKDTSIQNRTHGKIYLESIRKAVTFFKSNNIEVNVLIGFGHPAEVILDVSRLEYFDMIVMCTHGMGAAKRFTLGSTTDKVVHYSNVPVLIIR